MFSFALTAERSICGANKAKYWIIGSCPFHSLSPFADRGSLDTYRLLSRCVNFGRRRVLREGGTERRGGGWAWAEYCRARAQIRLSRDKNRGGWLRFSSLRSPGEITALKERNLPHIYHENEFRKVEERTVYLTCMCMMIRHEPPRVEGEKERSGAFS